MAVVEVADGKLKGSESDGVHSFKGIPFAAAVAGVNRWLPPRPPRSWSGERDATRFGRTCVQQKPPNKWLTNRSGRRFIEFIHEDEPAGDDCLNLNVWTPTLDTGAKLPVMVWIHGGAFLSGSGSMTPYDGTRLAQKEVVVVSVNYRLGLMGFFSAPGLFGGDFCVPNRGFMDQVASLRWVQENISAFGGAADNVTIFGESAGGQSVAVLLASPASRGLFRRAIVQSGMPELGVPLSHYERFAGDLLNAMGIESGDRTALSKLSARQTIDAVRKANRLLAQGSGKQYGKIRVYGFYGGVYETEFLPHSVLESIGKGAAGDIDLMIGTMRQDGRLFSLVFPGPEGFSGWLCMRLFKGMLEPRNDIKGVMDRYQQVMPGASKNAVREQIITDSVFRRGSVRAAEAHAASNPGRTFLYQFNWASPLFNGGLGAMHALDIPFVMRNLEPFASILGDVEPLKALSEAVSDAWVTFARTGTPSSPDLPEWQPFDTAKRATMVFNTESEIQYDVDSAMRKLWKNQA